MTDFLNAEDITKAVGAFTGEQRAPLRIPLPSSTTLAPAPRGSRGRPVFPSASLPTHPAGRWWSVEGGPQHFPNSARGRTWHRETAGRPCALPDNRNSRAPKAGWPRCEDPGPGPRAKTGVESCTSGSLWALGASFARHLEGAIGACFAPRDPFPDRSLSWLPECPSPFSGAQSSAPPATDLRGSEVTFP